MSDNAGQMSATQKSINWQLQHELFKGQYALTCDPDFPILMRISEETFAAMKEALRRQSESALERASQDTRHALHPSDVDVLVKALETIVGMYEGEYERLPVYQISKEALAQYRNTEKYNKNVFHKKNMKFMKPIPIWGLINGHGDLVFWADDKKTCLEQKWNKDEKITPLQIVERKK